jgi:DNA-binding MarR family transcriptional regulator
MGVRQLAAHMGVTASTMSITVDRLVQRGYVIRAVGAEDRRRVELRLTPAGLRVRGPQEVLDAALVGDMIDLLGPQERERALFGLELLASAAARLTSGQG